MRAKEVEEAVSEAAKRLSFKGPLNLSPRFERGASAKYERTASVPHRPSSCIVIASSPKKAKVRAPVILNVCPEMAQAPDKSCTCCPAALATSRMVVTTPSLVQKEPSAEKAIGHPCPGQTGDKDKLDRPCRCIARFALLLLLAVNL